MKKGIRYMEYTFIAIAIICIAVIIVLNTTQLYKYVIFEYNLEGYTKLSTEALMDNYKSIVYYLQNPFNEELIMKDFPMSESGRVHFEEVKHIFQFVYIIVVALICRVFVIIKNNKEGEWKSILLNILNKSSNIILILLGSISILSFIDFSKAFDYFHKVFFRNDYWIFDAVTDPVINALPEELFMLQFILIVCILAVFIVIVKIINMKFRKLRV